MLALLIDLGWKSAVIAGLAFLAHAAMHRRPAAERAALLQASLLALLALPLFALLLPALDLVWLPAQSSAVVAVMQPQAASSFFWDNLALTLYGAGVAALLLRFALGLWTLRRWTLRAQPVLDSRWRAAATREAAQIRRPTRLLVSSHAETPISWGISPAWILIGPATHDIPGQAEAVIAHEMAHIRRFDWLGLVVARLATALFWFNPLAWLLARQLSRDAELAADAEALRTVSRHDYADALLAVAGGRLAHRDANGMAFARTALARRIAAALDGDAARRVRPRVQAILLLSALVAAAPLASAQLVAAAPLPPMPLPARPAPAAPVAPMPPLPEPPHSPEGSLASAAEQPLAAAPAASKIRVAAARSGSVGVPDPRPSPVVSVAPSATRIIGPTDGQVTVGPQGATIIDGRTGARVVFGPNGVTLNGAPQDSPANDARRALNRGIHDVGGAVKDGINGLLKNSAETRAKAAGIEVEARRPTGG
jgi:beta-lactamase regulating signal transducer with metallopeptidase domain